MKTKFYLLLISILLVTPKAIGQSHESAQMFRQTPEHTMTNGLQSGIFQEKDWSFFSNAPIRSTPLVVGNNIYFGNAEGKFFCISKETKKQQWVFDAKSPLHSSPAYFNETVYFADASQTLYALNAKTGKKIWQLNFDKTLPYEWQFDYFQSSPTIANGKIFTGGGDGKLRIVDCKTGKEILQYATAARVRSTPAVTQSGIYFGDFSGKFYCLDLNGKLNWKFSTVGDTITPSRFSYDRKAIISSPIIKDDVVIFGSRDGYLYALNSKTGEEKWKFDYKNSWVLSSPIIYNNMVIQGTSDARFVNAINISTGKEIWRSRTFDVVFASPTIVGDIVYIGAFDGVMYCFDAKTGKRVTPGFMTGSNILSSAVHDGKSLYFGSDDGNLYALKTPLTYPRSINTVDSNFVFLKAEVFPRTFKTGIDMTLAETLRRRGYTPCEDDTTLSEIMKRTIVDKFKRKVVFATNYFPAVILDGNKTSLLRRFMDAGGEVLILNLNFAFFNRIPAGWVLRNHKNAGELLGIDFEYNDTRALKGVYPTFATEEGLKIGLPRFSNSLASVKKTEVNIVYAINEIGEATSWTKLYNNNGKFIQLWLDEFHNPEQMFPAIYKIMEKDYVY